MLYRYERNHTEQSVNPVTQEENFHTNEGSENIQEDITDQLRETRTQVLARMLRSYYLRMRGNLGN